MRLVIFSSILSNTWSLHSLGFIKRGETRIGEKVCAVNLLQNKTTEVEIVSPHFIDPEGVKQRG